MSAAEESLRLLRSIDDGIKKLVALTQRNPANAGGAIASDKDLDSPWGDEEVRFNPKDWTGPSMKGRRMSQCPAEFLELLAAAFDHFATKAAQAGELSPQGKPIAQYKAKSASRARGWALRVRVGKGSAPPPEAKTAEDDWGEDSAPRW